MTHIDEGTIHAWIDGALDATQSRAVEVHVAECATCAAAVAEARGFVAGASRILTALDDVPAGVVPKRLVPPASPAVPRRQWRASPWVTGIAAALVLAVGITTWRSGVINTLPQGESVRGAPDVAPTVPAAPPVEAARALADTSRTKSAVANEPQVRMAVVQPQRRSAAESRTVEAAAPPPSASAGLAKSEAEAAGVRPQPSPKLDFRAADMAAPAPSPSARERAMVEDAAVQRLAGCYRMDQELRLTRQLAGQVLGGAVGGVGGAKGAARVRAEVPAAAAAAREYASPGVLLRLDTAQKAMGYVVRATRSDSTIGWWSRVGDDSARVDLLSGASITVGARNRVSCPEP